MIRRDLELGRWHVEFYFCPDGFDIDEILDRMYDFGASVQRMRQALGLMEGEEPNRGFTFTNPFELTALVVIGPTTSGSEFINTLVHEIRHLANAVSMVLGVPLEGEAPSYFAGDAAMDLADVICQLGCRECRE